jgi:hypothetical protein
MTESAVELESLIARMAFGSVQESDDEGNENDGDNFAEQP